MSEHHFDREEHDVGEAEVAADPPIRHRSKPIELEYASELDNLLETPDNAVVMFYRNGCPHCSETKPVFWDLADNVHSTNLNPGAVPIVFAQIDAGQNLDAIEALRPGFFTASGRGAPTILFKRADGQAYIWDPERPRTKPMLAGFMSMFFDDPSLMPLADDLAKSMRNPDPDFLYFYTDRVTVVPRFLKPIDPSMTDIVRGTETLNAVFLLSPALRSRGAAFPVNRMDRPDIKVPSIYDRRENREYAYRDAMRWAQQAIAQPAPQPGAEL